MAELQEHDHKIPGILASLPVTISFRHSYRLTVDKDYGADADGRRGETAYMIDDEDVTDITVSDQPLAELHPDSRPEIMSQIAEYLETVEYESI